MLQIFTGRQDSKINPTCRCPGHQVPVVLAGVEHYSQKEADKDLVDTEGDGPMWEDMELLWVTWSYHFGLNLEAMWVSQYDEIASNSTQMQQTAMHCKGTCQGWLKVRPFLFDSAIQAIHTPSNVRIVISLLNMTIYHIGLSKNEVPNSIQWHDSIHYSTHYIYIYVFI